MAPFKFIWKLESFKHWSPRLFHCISFPPGCGSWVVITTDQWSRLSMRLCLCFLVEKSAWACKGLFHFGASSLCWEKVFCCGPDWLRASRVLRCRLSRKTAQLVATSSSTPGQINCNWNLHGQSEIGQRHWRWSVLRPRTGWGSKLWAKVKAASTRYTSTADRADKAE